MQNGAYGRVRSDDTQFTKLVLYQLSYAGKTVLWNMGTNIHPIKRTYFISFPRSGHHWVTGNLARYFGDAIHYCESYQQPDLRINVNPATNLEKNHDLDLNVTIGENQQALVLARRDVLYAIRSWYALLQIQEPFFEWVNQQQLYWLKFLAKWTLPIQPGERRIVFWYEDVKANPVAATAAMCQFLCDDPVDLKRVVAAVNADIDWSMYL